MTGAMAQWRACVDHDFGARDASNVDACAASYVQRRLLDCPHANAPDAAGP